MGRVANSSCGWSPLRITFTCTPLRMQPRDVPEANQFFVVLRPSTRQDPRLGNSPRKNDRMAIERVLVIQSTAANRVGQRLPESPLVDHLPNCMETCKHSSAVQKMQVFHRLRFRPQQRRYCTIVAGRNFTPREFFPRRFGEAADHLRWANRTKHAINEEFFSAGRCCSTCCGKLCGIHAEAARIKKPESVVR
jgi:hypothetical protein